MAINLCRHNPKSFVPAVRHCADTHELAKGKNTKDLIAYLNKCAPLTQVTFDEQGNQAVRENNTAVVAKDEDVPT